MRVRLISRVSKENLINHPDWAEAVPSYLVCRNSYDLDSRALIISEWVGNEEPILDFGCGDGRVVSTLISQGLDASGYEINQSWENQLYQTIVLHDVIDHLIGNPIEIFRRIYSILDPKGKVKVRCHPWCSRHGGHQILEANKAFAHLVYPELYLTEKIPDPISYYENIFSRSGFKIKEKIVYRRPVEDWILVNLGRKIVSHWDIKWSGYGNPSVIPFLEIEYIDYELNK